MDREAQLKLQAYLDGELAADEAKRVATSVARDPAAGALLEELRRTRHAFKGFEESLKVPETREFYWSKIKREIERLEVKASSELVAVSWLERWRRFLIPATSVALVAVAALLVARQVFPSHYSSGLETALEDSGAFTYHNFAAGTTLVWLSYPADNDVAPGDDADIID